MSSKNLRKKEFTIYGEPASKANSRRAAIIQGKPRFIKSKKALAYEEDFAKQCPQVHPPLENDVSVRLDIYYKSRRPDLDESLILDCMQSVKESGEVVRNNIYLNDRQVKEKHVYWHLDRDNPRAEISVMEIVGAE